MRLASVTAASWAVLTTLVLVAVSGCGENEPASPTLPLSTGTVEFDQGLHDELMDLRRGQIGRTERTERFKQILEEYGWPTFDLVGRDGSSAAWTIMYRSDLDPEYWAAVLKVVRAAAQDGQASWRNVARLDDLVAVVRDKPQMYGTQITCTQYGARVNTPLDRPEQIERLREKVGLKPMHVFLDEMDRYCARKPPGG